VLFRFLSARVSLATAIISLLVAPNVARAPILFASIPPRD
jgi:hypothetical protein